MNEVETRTGVSERVKLRKNVKLGEDLNILFSFTAIYLISLYINFVHLRHE